MDLRDRLGELLVAAAELEHGVVCQYLFAAFSMKRHPDEGKVSWKQLELMRRWEADLLLISRQEMEHLGLVANLLTAIGEAPHFLRPPFPIPSEFYPAHDRPKLERFGPDFLKRLIRLEQPAKQTTKHAQLASSLAVDLDAETNKSVGELYEEIAGIFRQLDGPDLFIGPPSAQRVTLEIVPVPLRGVTLPPNTTLYDVTFNAVTDLKSALAVIKQIVEEGEGSPQGRATSHYGRLLEIASELRTATERDPSFAPARPVMDNPTRDDITDPGARRIFDLCDDAYAITVLLLMRYFGQSDETAPEVAALQQAVFFPMMTAVIRPLGEILTQLPAADDPGVRAGPSFTLPRRLAFLPHRQAAWSLIEQHLDAMAADAKRLSTDSTYPAPVRSRLEFAYQNLARIAYNFRTAMKKAAPGP
jgi:hypothetical protein